MGMIDREGGRFCLQVVVCGLGVVVGLVSCLVDGHGVTDGRWTTGLSCLWIGGNASFFFLGFAPRADCDVRWVWCGALWVGGADCSGMDGGVEVPCAAVLGGDNGGGGDGGDRRGDGLCCRRLGVVWMDGYTGHACMIYRT